MKTPRIPLAGVVGWPISHSKSPAIHGYWLKKHGIDGYSVPIGIEPDRFEDTFVKLPDLGFRGVSVTIPFKLRALALADQVSDRARAIGAANTIVFDQDQGILADNTDGIGFLNNLIAGAPDWDPTSGPALVLGAGGAARAIVSALLDAGVPEVRISNRTRAKAEKLADHFGGASVVDWDERSGATAGAATVVNTTSLGMVGQHPLDISLEDAPKTALVTDIVYAPLETDLLAQARQRGLATVDGLGMLLHQAVPGFTRWFGVEPTVDETLRKMVLSA